MNTPPNVEYVPGLAASMVLAITSASFGFFEQADVFLSLLAKLVAIAAGGFSIFVAYQNYKDKPKEKL